MKPFCFSFGFSRVLLLAGVSAVAGATAWASPVAQNKPLPPAKATAKAEADVSRISNATPTAKPAVPFLRAADTAFGASRSDDAIKAYTQAALADPQNSTTRLCLGVALSHARRADLALPQFKKAASLAPNDVLAALLLQNAVQESGDPSEAQELYLDIAQKWARKDSKPGLDASGSITRLQGAIKQFPQSAILHLLIGDAYQLSESWSEADAAYETARKIAPRWAKPCVNLGLSRLAQNKTDEAIAIFNRALVLDPSSVQARLWKGNAELKAGRGEAAARSFSFAASDTSGRATPSVRAQAATGMGQALAQSRKYDKALASLQNAQKIAPADPVPPALIGEVHIQNGEYAEAAGAYSTALRLTRSGGLFSNRPVLYRALAEAQLCAHKPDDALVSLGRALTDEPESASLWHRLKAQAFFDRRETRSAQEELRAALDSTPPSEYPLDTLNAIAARGLAGRMASDYQSDYDNAASGIRRTTTPGGGVSLQSPKLNGFAGGGFAAGGVASRGGVNNGPGNAENEAKLRALTALANLARYRTDTMGEIHLRTEIASRRGTGQDWLLLAEAYDSRAGQPANARNAYTKALEVGGLSASAVARVRERLVRLNAPLYKP